MSVEIDSAGRRLGAVARTRHSLGTSRADNAGACEGNHEHEVVTMLPASALRRNSRAAALATVDACAPGCADAIDGQPEARRRILCDGVPTATSVSTARRHRSVGGVCGPRLPTTIPGAGRPCRATQRHQRISNH